MQNRTWGSSPPCLGRREERRKAGGSLNLVLGFRLSDGKGDFNCGLFFLLRFSFIVITKYIPMMENYGSLLAIWQLCLYLVLS